MLSAVLGRIIGLVGLVLLALMLHIAIGSHLWVPPRELLAELLRGPGTSDDQLNSIIWQLRLPRALGCVVIGAMLAAAGCAFQGFFRNPLAEPYVIGVSSGAGLGGTLVLISGILRALPEGSVWGELAMIVGAFVFGLGSLGLVLILAQVRAGLNVNSLLIAGVVVGSLLASLLTLALILSGEDANRILRWLFGSAAQMSWPRLGLSSLVWLFGSFLLMRQARALNVFSVSEQGASTMGVNVGRMQWHVLTAGTLMSAVAVGAVGIIGFLGLVAPHLARKLLGVDMRLSLVGSSLLGGALLCFADLLAQRLMPGVELPVGAVTALLGAPVLLFLLQKKA